ncbi:esterase OVCA2 [Trichonephila clavipes]|uniref:Esterase OVCA2 n=1 Tax=Trichonephila clavipes TaxID=2585209 RepID=A0A8X6SP30_TRICX|nr:esterase OVCA2 [Trichonephila clavipes]
MEYRLSEYSPTERKVDDREGQCRAHDSQYYQKLPNSEADLHFHFPELRRSEGMMATNRKLKLLCLHGYRQDADSFKDKIGGFKKSIKGVTELGCSWWFCDESNDFNSRTECEEANGFESSVNAINEAFKTQGPFDGILGFSQGGAMAALICSLKEHQDRSEVLIPLFKSSSVVYHDGGHFIPSKSNVKNEYLPFFKNMYCFINNLSN